MSKRYLEVDECNTCPFRGHRGGFGGFGSPAHVPTCDRHPQRRKLPYSEGVSWGQVIAYVKPGIPEWCPLATLEQLPEHQQALEDERNDQRAEKDRWNAAFGGSDD